MSEKYRSLEHHIRNVISETSFVSSPNATITGHVKSGRAGYSSFDGGDSVAMRRVADQENDAKKEQEASKDKMNDEIKRRQQASNEEVNPNKNSEERKKVVNVSRMDDENPTSEKSKLGKTASIKTKIIEEPTKMFSKNFGLSASLIDAVRGVMEEKKEDALKHNNAKKMVGGKPNAVDVHPKLDTTMKESLKDNQKKIDKAPPFGKITKADFTALRSEKCPKCGKVDGCKCGSMKEDVESLEEGMRLVHTHVNGPHSAKVYKDTDWGEYRVKYFKNGKHLPSSDSHHDDSDDAHETAKYQIKQFREGYELDERNKENKFKKDLYVTKLGMKHSPHASSVYYATEPTEKDSQKKIIKRGKQIGREILQKEDIEFSEEEIARLNDIAASFNSEIVDEATKKSTKVPSATTTISAPIKGANQDQSGFGVSRDVANYTISDETRDSPEWETASPGERVKIVKKEAGKIDKKITGKKITEEKKDNDPEHIMMQLRKVVSTQGRYPITHLDGRQTKITPQLAVHAMGKHIAMKTNEKQDFEHKLHKSQDSMRSALS